MRYTNPVLKGFYPDPSVCSANGKFYLVCSSFQYFPGVPLFESDNLVNWTQIGHVLTRKSQVMLDDVRSSGGVFAPTIRFHNGRFYMVTNNNSTQENFYVYTDDIYGEWSDPIVVDQDGIDPSLYFEGDRCFFISNGTDDDGKGGIIQCEIDVATGKKLSPGRMLWKGSGGRYLESPHMYRIGDYYYLMAAEGGTEYGHMVTVARADNVWGPFTGYQNNPVLTNRDKAPYLIQAIGHGDLIQDNYGDWHILTLGFRQIHLWMPFHHLGREVFLTPVSFGADGWFTAGTDGTTDEAYEIKGEFVQREQKLYTFENTDWDLDWCFMRHPKMQNYELGKDSLTLHGTDITLDEIKSPTFIGLRQRDFSFALSAHVKIDDGEAGITAYMTEIEHYEVALRRIATGFEALLRLNIGGIRHIQKSVSLNSGEATLIIRAEAQNYHFYVQTQEGETLLGTGMAKYLSSEVATGFTGVILGLYAVNGNATFTDYSCKYESAPPV